MTQTIPGILVDQARAAPDRLVLRDGGSEWTASALLLDVQMAAKAFMAHGLQKGDRFAIWAPNHASWIIAALGGQMAGGVLVPLNTRYKGVEAGDILARSGARLLFTVQGFLGADYPAMLAESDLPDLQRTVLLGGNQGCQANWQSFLSDGAAISDAELDTRFAALGAEDLCDILFTSGTTGRPKGAMTTHGQNVRIYREWAGAVGVGPDDVFLIVNPFFHAFGYKAGWLSALIAGALILPHAVFEAEDVLKRIEAERVSVLPGPPTLFQSLLSHPRLANHDISSLSKTITGAASVPESLVRDMKSVLGFDTVLTGYGLTEASGTVALSRAGDDIETIARFSGRPLAGIEIRIVGPEEQDQPFGEQGEILVRGYNVMRGYLDDPEATAEAIAPDGWLRTGDIGFQDPRGYLKITDRAKDMFITGGFNCYPAEIESLLLSHPDVADVAVVGAPDERLGEVCHAHIVRRADSQLGADELIGWARGKMANFKVPRHVAFHESLPRNAGGKVQKFLLRDFQNAQKL